MDRDAWCDSIDERLSTFNERLNTLEVKSAVDEVHRNNVESRLGNIENSLTWLVRLIIGAIVLASINFILSGGLSIV